MQKQANQADNQAAYFFHQGTTARAFDYLGAHREGSHIAFRVWAPNAEGVSVCGEFNHWNPDEYPMARVTEGGIWEGLLPAPLFSEGTLYKYCIRRDGRMLYKADPYGFSMGCPPETASKQLRKMLSGRELTLICYKDTPIVQTFPELPIP